MAENNTEVTKVAINDIGTEEDFIKAVDSTIKNFDDGDLVEGTVVKIDHDEVLLDIGYKTEGVIPSRELSIKKDVDPDEVVEVGDTIEALVVTKEDKEGRLILSKKRAQYERAWGDIEKIKEADGVVEGTVIEAVKGGLIVDIGLRGFLPASLVEMRRVRDLSPYIGQKIKAKILELDKNRNNVVLSRRQYLEETQSEVRETFLSQLKKGQIREGVVSAICPRTSARRSRPRSSSSTRTATTWSSPVASTSRRPSPKCARPSCPSLRRARSVKASCPPSSTSARSSIWAVLTA